MKLLILVALFAVVYSETMSLEGDEDAWELYKKAHNKTYQSYDEEMNRRAIYVSNVRYIEKHNIEADLSRHSYWMGVNQFTDMTTAEFRAVMLGYEKSVSPSSASTFLPPLNVEIPDSVDWRKKGYVTGVKNQNTAIGVAVLLGVNQHLTSCSYHKGSCGSCWAFSTTGSLEGQHFRKTRQLVSLSEEQLVDCDRYNSGCQGGNVGRAFAYIHQNQGIDTEECYPYTAGKQGKRGSCKFRRSCVGATVKNYMRVHGGESYLKKAVATMGPISVAICANDNFMHYRTGVFNDPQCSPTKLNHAVLVVGYGQDSRMDYWLVKNSWGTSWGMGGYVKMARNRDNQCGIASDAVFPLV